MEQPVLGHARRLSRAGVSPTMTLFLGTACGLIAANVYYAQPLAGSIGKTIGLSAEMAGLVVTLTQIGYGIGLLLIVPLGDLIENRLLVTSLVGAACIALVGAALSKHALLFLPSVLLIGLGSVAVQVLVPYASHLARPEERGTMVGNISSGLMAGVMLSRPASSWIASYSNWRCVFLLSAALLLALSISLAWWMPPRVPEARPKYLSLLSSMSILAARSKVLRRRAIYQCFLYGAFSIFWTTVPVLLTGPAFHFSQRGVALFAALGGGGGVLGATIGGRIADRGWSYGATACSMIAVATAFLLTLIPSDDPRLSFSLLIVAAIVLDCGMTVNFVLGQRKIFLAGAQYRSRLNGLYMAFFFVAGAVGSALGGWAYAKGGWSYVSYLGVGLPALGLLWWLTDLPESRQVSGEPSSGDARSDEPFAGK